MRLIKRNIDDRDGTGSATLLPEDPEDMWHAYNLIQPNDLLRAPAVRKVTATAATGSVTTKRHHMTLTIRVLSTDFDPGASQLHVSGQVAAENDFVGLGQHHTLDLELQRNFTLEKEGGWDSIALETLNEATDERNKAEIWAVVMQEGLANVCLITEHQTLLRQRVEVAIPRKRKGGISDHEKALSKFFTTLLETVLRQIDLSITPPKPLLLASPGFLASAFLNHIKLTATTTNNKPLLALLPSIIVTHSSSGHVHALHEVLSSPAITSKLSDTKYARETALMDRFFELLRLDDGRAWYGPREVERAVEKGAVGRGGGVLLISDKLFRANDVATRKRWVALVDRVAQVEGGEVRKLSSLHESGKRLEGLGNIAAILTYPLEDLDESEPEDDDEITDAVSNTQKRENDEAMII